jgi:methionine synthase II (cobalamin-independent)
VGRQVECGIDIVTDGEFSKPGFFTYIQERLEGFEARRNPKLMLFQQEVGMQPGYASHESRDFSASVRPITHADDWYDYYCVNDASAGSCPGDAPVETRGGRA